MELRHLRNLAAVAEEGNVTRAAERLRIAQPALSQQIRALEQELGIELWKRRGRGIELTAAGQALAHDATQILQRVEAAVRHATAAHAGVTGRVRIGLTDTASFSRPVTTLIREAREAWPAVEFVLHQARAVDLLSALQSGALDVAFIRSPRQDTRALEWQPFLREGYIVALPKGHALESRRTLRLDELAGESLILPFSRNPAADHAAELTLALRALSPPTSIAQRTPSYTMTIGLVAAGLGCAVVPAVLLPIVKAMVVARQLVGQPALRSTLYIVVDRHRTSPAVSNFLTIAKRHASPATF